MIVKHDPKVEFARQFEFSYKTFLVVATFAYDVAHAGGEEDHGGRTEQCRCSCTSSKFDALTRIAGRLALCS